MYKHLFRIVLWVVWILGMMSLWVVNAETTISEPYGHIEYTLNGNENFEAQVITVTGDDGTVITILDRNLWAKKAWTGCDKNTNWWYCPYDDTYWYHFQWWNNHWFKPWCDLSWSTDNCSDEITSGAVNWQVDVTTISYDPVSQQYYESGVFYRGYDNWLTDNSKVDLWWWSTGGTDTIISTSSLNWDDWKVDESTVTNRQWPCPRGWHVPSVWELNKLVSMMTGSNRSEKVTQLHSDLYIPFAGSRYYRDASVYNMGRYAGLWSSSPYSAPGPFSRSLDLNVDGYLAMSTSSRANTISVRCFYDSYQPFTQSFTLTFLDDGVEVASWSVVSGEVRSGTIPTPDEKEGYEFDYRYADGEPDAEFNFTSPITGDVKLRAHWTFIAKIPNGIYTWLNWWDISVVWNDETRWDINLTIAWENLDWRYYWWWDEQADDNRDTNPTEWDEHNNDWWWGGDTFENGFSPNPVNFEERQWPCPAWYHVPSRGEWNKLVIAWCNIDTWCNGWYTDEYKDWIPWDLEKLDTYRSNDNRLVSISWSEKWELWDRFKEEFNTPPNGRVYAAWSSSPHQWNGYGAWYMRVDYYFFNSC